MKWLRALFAKRQRAIDVKMLWPEFKKTSRKHGLGIDAAREGFMEHAFLDSAWSAHLTHVEIKAVIHNLK